MPNTNITHEEAKIRAKTITVSSYEISLELEKNKKTFRSVSKIKFLATPQSESFIDAITHKIEKIVLNNTPLAIENFSTKHRITLPNLQDKNELLVVAQFDYMNTGEGLHRFVDPVDEETYLYTQFEVPDARRVFAVFEQPDMKANFTFNVTAPKEWKIISNSPTPVAKPINKTHAIWNFAPTPKISSYITAIIAGPYQSEHSEYVNQNGTKIPLGIFSRKSLAKHVDANNIFEITKNGFKFYEENFQTPYPFTKYDQIFVPDFNAGAMENASAVTFLEDYIFDSKVTEATIERRTITILHELAHMWFGDLVTMRWWNDLWLNESFAEYMSTLATAEATQWKDAWSTFAATEKNWAYRQDQLSSTHPIVAKINDLEDVLVNFDGITYAKGASVLKQLVSWVGKEPFMLGIKAYFEKYAWKNTQLEDFLAELEKASGRNLKAWAEQWLETAGVNTLKSKISVNEHKKITNFMITQTAPKNHPTLRQHRLAIGFYNLVDNKFVRTKKFEIDISGSETEVNSIVGFTKPDLVVINDDDLTYAKIRFDEESLKTIHKNFKNLTNSLTRTLIWNSLWDTNRDGQTAPHKYVQFILENIKHETNSSMRSVLLKQLATTIDLYLDRTKHKETIVNTAQCLWQLSKDAIAGSDAQLQFIKMFANYAHTKEFAHIVQQLLENKLKLPGLIIDTDLSWHLLNCLVTAGYATEEAIMKQFATDKTANGMQELAYAKATIPSLETKKHTWDSMLTTELTNSILASTIAGFTEVVDSKLLEPFVDLYFAAIKKVWETKTYEIAQQIIFGLYPTVLANQGLVDQTEKWLQENIDANPALQRLMLENLDGVKRALVAQKADLGE